jgi:uncharacterized LabA/DUF88 family protein
MKQATKPADKQVYAFVDSQNLNLGTQLAGWKLDWRKFLEYLKKEHGVTRAYLFIGHKVEHEAMYEQLHDLGYSVVLKPTIETAALANPQTYHDQKIADKAPKDKSGEDLPKPVVKGNVDTDLVLYVMKELPNYDQAVIVSGDGDFLALIEYLDERQKLRAILTPNWKYSSLLKPFDKNIIRLDQHRRELEHKDFRRRVFKRDK